MSDRALYLVRVVSAGAYATLMRTPPAERVLTSTLGYMPMLEFPGVCATLVTQNTVADAAPILYPGDYILVLSCDLLRQRNYHFNINDDCGHLSDHNTVFPWQLPRFLKQNKLCSAIAQLGDDYVGNEIVFHDPIKWAHVIHVLDRHNFKLPRRVHRSAAIPDMELCPAYVHPPRYLTHASLEFLRALVAQFAPAVARTATSKQELAQCLRAHTCDYFGLCKSTTKRAHLDMTALVQFTKQNF